MEINQCDRVFGDGDAVVFRSEDKQAQMQNHRLPKMYSFPGQGQHFYPGNTQFQGEFLPARLLATGLDFYPGRRHCFSNSGAGPFNQRRWDLKRKPSSQNGAFEDRRRWLGRAAKDDGMEEWWQRKRQKMQASGYGARLDFESGFGSGEGYGERHAEDGFRGWLEQEPAGGRAVQEDRLSSVSAQLSPGSNPATARQKPEACLDFREQEKPVGEGVKTDFIRDRRFPLHFEISSSKQSGQAVQRFPLNLDARRKQEQAQASAAERAGQEDCITSVSAQPSPGSYFVSARQNIEAHFQLNEQEKPVFQATETVCISNQRFSPELEVSSLLQSGKENQRSAVDLEICRRQEQVDVTAVGGAVQEKFQEKCMASVSAQRSPGGNPASARQKPEADFGFHEQEKPVQATETYCITKPRFPRSSETSSSNQTGQAVQLSPCILEISQKQVQSEVSAVGRAFQEDCSSSISARLSQGSYPTFASQKHEAYFGFREQEKAVAQATETDCISNQHFPLDLERSSLKQSGQANQSFPLNSEISPSKQRAHGTYDCYPDDICKVATSLTTNSVVFRKKRSKPIATRSWGKRLFSKACDSNGLSENERSLSPITESAEDRLLRKEDGGHAKKRLCMEKQVDFDKFKSKHLEFDKQPHRETITERIDGRISQTSSQSSNKQRNEGYIHKSSMVGLDKSLVVTESNGLETAMEHVDVVNSAIDGRPTQPKVGAFSKRVLGSSLASIGKPLSPVSEECCASDSGSSMLQKAPYSFEVPTRARSRRSGVITSSPDSIMTADKIGLVEKRGGCANSIGAHKPVAKHFMFKRPVAIKSKNCYEVVKRKSILLTCSSDENEAFLKEKWDQKWSSRDVASKLHRIRICLSSKEWNVKERSPTDLVSRRQSKDGKENEIRSLLLETLKKFDNFRCRASRNVCDSGGRADLKAAMLMKRYNLRINELKRVGSVPGIEVGDQFFFRLEMLVVGLHMQVQAGIDYIGAKESKYNEPVAVSIVASVGYDYDLNKGETLIYTGQGGNAHKDEKFRKDQKLVRGNLALRNSHRQKLPVRVIRCYDTKNEKSDKIYSYDGLYQVNRMWNEKGRSGFLVYKFCLQRLPGQPQLVSAFALSFKR